MPFQPETLDTATLKRLAKRLHHAEVLDHEHHRGSAPSLARSQECLAIALSFQNWDAAIHAFDRRKEASQTTVASFHKSLIAHPFPHQEDCSSFIERVDKDAAVWLAETTLRVIRPRTLRQHRMVDLLSEIEQDTRHSEKTWYKNTVARLLEFDVTGPSLWEEFLNALIARCQRMGQNGLVLGLLYLDMMDELRQPLNWPETIHDTPLWTHGLSDGLPAVIGGLLAMHRVSPIHSTDNVDTWHERWAVLLGHAKRSNHLYLVIFARWLLMNQPADFTPSWGQLITNMMANISPQGAVEFSILWQASQYQSALEGALTSISPP